MENQKKKKISDFGFPQNENTGIKKKKKKFSDFGFPQNENTRIKKKKKKRILFFWFF